MADDPRALAQRSGHRRAFVRRMPREDEVGGGRQYLEAKPEQTTVQPLPAFDYTGAALLKPGFVLQRHDSAGLGGPAKGVGVKTVLHTRERLDQVGVADRIANP